jgi:CheY-like chemotaxis protein
MSEAARSDDLLARIVGDVFALVLNNVTDEQGCAEMARRILETLAEAKRGGGNGFRFFVPGADSPNSARIDMTTQLRQVAERDELRLHYQQPSLASGEIVAVEALVRWQHPQRRLVPPNAFIPIAERTGLLISISEWVLREACRQAKAWRDGYHVLTACGGAEALELLALNPVQVIISDQRMPEMSGVEFLSRVKEIYPQTVRIVLSDHSELSTVTDAINRGAIWKYISKPWDDEARLQEIRSIFRSLRKE